MRSGQTWCLARLSTRIAVSMSLLSFACGSPGRADDWGYEGTPPPLEEQSAAGMLKSIKSPSKAATPAKKATPKAATTKSQNVPKVPAQKNEALEDDSAALGGTRNGGGFARSSAPAPQAEPSTGSLGVARTTEYIKKPKAPATVAKGPMSGATPTLPSAKETSFSKLDNPLENFTDKSQQAVRCWLQLFQVVSRERMDYADQKKLEAYMLQKARQGAKQTEELRSILKFWPQLMNDIRNKQELELEYSDLFRALLRVHERYSTEKTNVEGSEFASDSDMITRLLGLQRTAVSGNPSFSEDAVNAYADMAIFIYEQQHAGRTIDANDNRALFAKVVVEKFNQAPTDNDKRAMSSFDLAWAKFKIIWHDADEEKRKILLEKLVKTGAGSTLSVAKDPLLDLVLSNWPWKTSL